MIYRALDVAKYINNYCKEHNIELEDNKIHKLLYYAQAHFLVYRNKCCFAEPISATSSGPFILDLKARELNGAPSVTFSEKDINLLNEVIEKYGHSTDKELTMWTKSQFPYKSVYDSNEMWHTITTLSIAKYFKGLWNI